MPFVLGESDSQVEPPVPPMMVVVAIHAAVMIALDQLQRPLAVGILVAGVLALELGLLAVTRSPGGLFLGDAASQVVAGVAVALDGGTESPLFFWVLLLFAGQALRHGGRRLSALAIVVLVTYAGVIAAIDELTVASITRFALLLAFCGGLVYLRRHVDREAVVARRLDQLIRVGLDSAPLGGAVLDEHLAPLYLNERAATLLADVDLHHALTRVLDSDGRVLDLTESGRRGVSAAMPEPRVVRIEQGDGVRHVRVLSVPVGDDTGPLMVLFVEDVTDAVNLGEERRRFLEAAAHQFRTPLTPVMGYAQMLAEGHLGPEEARKAGEVVLRSAVELEQLLDKLSTLLRMRSAEVPHHQDLTMQEACRSLAASVQRLEGALEWDGDPGAVARCAPEPAKLALTELVENGVLHGRPPVVVRWTRSEGEVLVTVSDAGRGPELANGAELAEAWAIPYRSTAVSERMGSHLGLSQAAILTELAGGRLQFVRRDGAWAFEVRFPATASPAG